VFAIIRVDTDAPEEHAVTVEQVVRELTTAEAEISRLNALDGDKGCGYFWQATPALRGGAGRRSPVRGSV
jgi:hypothetical protein